MYLGSWAIDQLLTFTVNTHDPTTLAATDADSAPSYRVYEDETSTPLLTGSLALLDSTNTAGFYSEQITLSAANGFERGKSYTVYVSATVGGIEGTLSHSFQIAAAVDLTYILGTLLTETSGQLAAAFKKFFNVASPTGTVNSLPDAVAGAANGLLVVTDAIFNRAADHFWRRDHATVRASSNGDTVTERSGLGAVSKLVNRLKRNTGSSKLEIYEEDDITVFFYQTYTAATEDPITEVNTD